MKGTGGKSKTGLALSKQLLATLYAQGTPNILRVMLYPAFLGSGIKF